MKKLRILPIILTLICFTSCDNEKDGHRIPLFSELYGRMELVSGTAKDSKTGKETTLTGSDELRMSFIFNSGTGNVRTGYYVLNNVYVPLTWTTNEDKYYATLTIPANSDNETRLFFERQTQGSYVYNDPILSFTYNDIEFKGSFRYTDNLSEDYYEDKVIGTWILHSMKGWVYDEETDKKITINQNMENENIVFEFLSGGKGNITLLYFDDED